ncbi:heparinase II/III-family protein, partial [candidate division KSB1 bacterium]|nr:heparinase II/III-family protein [candidate division KSB1 bacterium]
DFKYAAEHYHEACLWLLGPESFAQFEKLKAEPPARVNCLLPESGYAILREGWKNNEHYLIFDCGPQSHGLFADENVSTAHGHADPLSILLCAHGQPMLIDAGMLTYNGELAWQNYFRSGMAHNTVTVDERSACRLVGRLGYSHVPEVAQTFATFQPDFDFVEATYKGFGKDVRHRRAVFHRHGEYWMIFDSFEGEGEHVLDRWFHFAPNCQLHNIGEGVVAALPRFGSLLLRELTSSPSELEIFKGGAQPEQGWHAPQYGIKLPAPVLRLRTRAALPQQFCTLLLPFGDKPPILQHEIDGEFGTHKSEPCTVRLATAHGNDLLACNFPGELQTMGALTTDAKLTFLHRDLISDSTIVSMVSGTRLSLNGVEVFSTERATDARVLSREIP